MTVSVTYNWSHLSNVNLGNSAGGPDVESLAGGGFAALNGNGSIFNASGGQTAGWTGGGGAQFDVLSNGNILLAYVSSIFIDGGAPSTASFRIINSATGADIAVPANTHGQGGINHLDGMTALTGGGFWVLDGNAQFDGINSLNAGCLVFDNSGNYLRTIKLLFAHSTDITDMFTYQKTTLDALDGGGVVMTSLGNGGGLQVRVFNASGGIVKQPYFFEGSGTSAPAFTAMANGGFAIAYEVVGPGGSDVDIKLTRFDASGNLLGSTLFGDTNADANPYLTRLSNGLLVLGMHTLRGDDNDASVTLIDPNTGQQLTQKYVSGGTSIQDEEHDVAVVGYGLGQVAEFHTNTTLGKAMGETLQAERSSTGDGAAHALIGDELVDRMFGNGGNDALYGGGNNDELVGGAGNDTMNGGTGVNTMRGGAGNDTYTVGGNEDLIDETSAGSDGYDTVQSTVSFTLPTNVEALLLMNAAANGTGNASNNDLQGNAAANVLNGAAGADTMRGLGGNDTYVVDNGGDLVDEVAAGSDGYDTVYSYIDYVLGTNIEALVLLGGAVNGTGNALDNTLVGDGVGNVLNGSFGADVMKGLGGNDTYVVDNAGDVVNETDAGSDGWDTVYGSINYTLGINVEALVLQGSLELSGTGNSAVNYLQGNDANNGLKGGGGNDTIKGMGGKDKIDGGGGSDTADFSDKTNALTVHLNGSHTVNVKVGHKAEDAIKNIENLIGSVKADHFTGESKANSFDGSLGKDVFAGGGGNDRFVFSTALGPTNADTITDFTHKHDKLVLSLGQVSWFLGTDVEKAEFFAKDGAHKAHDANDRLIYNETNGNLYFDVDGKDGAAAVLFAKIGNHADLDFHDFDIV